MADHDQRAGPVVEEVLERPQRVEVEVVGGLVEQQHVGRLAQHEHQLQPAALAARQQPDRAPTGRRCRTRSARAARRRSSRAGGSGRPPPRAPAASSGQVDAPLVVVADPHGRAHARRRPCRGGRRPASTSSSVDLPLPLGPTTPSRSPGSSARSTPRNSRCVAVAVGRRRAARPPCRRAGASARGRPAAGRRAGPARGRGPSTTAVAAAMWALGLRVRAGRAPAQPGQLGPGQVAARALGRRPRARPARPGRRGSEA